MQGQTVELEDLICEIMGDQKLSFEVGSHHVVPRNWVEKDWRTYCKLSLILAGHSTWGVSASILAERRTM